MTVKKLSVLLLAALLVFLCACGGSGEKATVSASMDEDGNIIESDDGDASGADAAGTDADGTETDETTEVGQELAATYAADHIFTLNCDRDDTFNPYTTGSAWNRVVDMLVYENLVELDDSFEAQPNLITGWQTDDGINWVFTVDTTRVFHDGGTMTAEDAVYSIQLAMSYGGRYETRLRDIEGISALDDGSFAVALSEANYRFYQLLDIPCIEYGTGEQARPAGTGPYMFSGTGRYLSLDENHPLADEMPLRSIYLREYTAAEDILQAFEDSYLDLVTNDPTGISSLGYSSTNIIKYVDTTNIHYLGYNMADPLMSQSVYRAAFTYGIDRASIVSDVMQGSAAAATLPIHPDSSLYPQEIADSLNYTAAGMRTALENLGAADVDGDGWLEFTGVKHTFDMIVCSESATKVSSARAIANSLRSFGMDINLRELSYDDFMTALEDGDYDIYYAEVRLCSDWDLRLLLQSGGALNYGGYTDGTLDGLLSSFLSAPEGTLSDSVSSLCTYIGQYAPITVICFEKSEVLYHRGVLSGLNPTQDNIFYGMQNWTADLGEG